MEITTFLSDQGIPATIKIHSSHLHLIGMPTMPLYKRLGVKLILINNKRQFID